MSTMRCRLLKGKYYIYNNRTSNAFEYIIIIILVSSPNHGPKSIRIRWTVKGIDVWSYSRCSAGEDTSNFTCGKVRRVSRKIEANTIESFFQQLQARFRKKRQRHEESRTRNKTTSKISHTPVGAGRKHGPGI